MLKSLAFSLLSLMLVISILAPSIEVLCKSDYDNMLVMDFNEEENNKEESEKKFDQKKLFFSSSIENKSHYLAEEITRIQIGLYPYSDFSVEIVLPPPKA